MFLALQQCGVKYGCLKGALHGVIFKDLKNTNFIKLKDFHYLQV